MCGRFAQSVPLGKLIKIDLYDEMNGVYSGNYNVAPSQDAFSVSVSGSKRVMKPMKWGLIPSWTKPEKAGTGLMNARFETLTDKPSFKNSYKKRRCLIPVAGFFEWQKDGKQKVPFFISSGRDSDGDFIPMLLCGIYDIWMAGDDEAIETFSIITTEALGKMKPIHARMPLILDAENIPLWLGSDYTHEAHNEIIRSFNAENLEIYRVSDFVNSYMHNTPQCIEPFKV
jgi:putative SOS response-associated peptidase YedK